MRKNLEPTKYPREKNFGPRNAQEKNFGTHEIPIRKVSGRKKAR